MRETTPDRAAAIAPVTTLRPGVLDGTAVIVAGPASPHAVLADAVAEGCTALGAAVVRLSVDADPDTVESAARALPAGPGPERGAAATTVLVCDAAGALAVQVAAADADEPTAAPDHPALGAALAGVWTVVRVVAAERLLPAQAPTRVILLAAPGDGSALADAGRAALENLARTLSVEWARHQVTTVAVAPGAGSTPDEVATLVAYLASPAGAYYSGCQLDLRGSAG